MLNLIVAPRGQNPKAEKSAKKAVKVLKAEKVEYSVYFSMSMQDISTNIQELLNLGESDFILVGDDTLIHSFINTVKDLSKVKVGIIPTGKHNDFANYIEVSKKPKQTIKDILEKNIEEIDYLLLNNSTKIINNILVGASVELYEIFKTYKLQNALTKKFLTLKYGNKFEGIELAFITNKSTKPKYENIFELDISNGGLLYGNHISPLSNVRDGLFNLNFSVEPEKEDRKKYLKLFKKGDQIYSEKTKQLWQNSVKIVNPDKRIKILADSQIMTVEELNVQVVENGLKIYKKID